MNDLDNAVEMFKALGHPLRLKICLGLIEKGVCNVSTMVERLQEPQGSVSHQLGILRKAGLIRYERKGKTVCYYLADNNIRKFLKTLDPLYPGLKVECLVTPLNIASV